MDPDRREFLSMAALALSAAPAWSRAQAVAGPMRKRVSICLGPSNAADPVGPARKAWGGLFAGHGLVDGRDIEIDIVRATRRNYLGEGATDWEAVARKVVATRPDLIVMTGPWLLFIAPLTNRIPIVFFGGFNDPRQFDDLGIDSLNRPGRNVTGVDIFPVEMQGKILEMLKELRPDARRHAIVGLVSPRLTERIGAMGRDLGMDVAVFAIGLDPPAAEVADTLRAARIDTASFMWNSRDRDLHDALEKLRIASAFPQRGSVEAGGLLSFEPRGDFIARVVVLSARILRGERVGTIPVEQARDFRIVINRRTAKALGITVPASILVRVNEAIE